MKTLALECSDTFEEYDPESIVIKINIWRQDLESLVEEVLKPRLITMKRSASL